MLYPSSQSFPFGLAAWCKESRRSGARALSRPCVCRIHARLRRSRRALVSRYLSTYASCGRVLTCTRHGLTCPPGKRLRAAARIALWRSVPICACQVHAVLSALLSAERHQAQWIVPSFLLFPPTPPPWQLHGQDLAALLSSFVSPPRHAPRHLKSIPSPEPLGPRSVVGGRISLLRSQANGGPGAAFFLGSPPSSRQQDKFVVWLTSWRGAP